VLLQEWDLPLTINISLNDCELLKSVTKQLLKMLFLREDEDLIG